jgi:hypothetical protein
VLTAARRSSSISAPTAPRKGGAARPCLEEQRWLAADHTTATYPPCGAFSPFLFAAVSPTPPPAIPGLRCVGGSLDFALWDCLTFLETTNFAQAMHTLWARQLKEMQLIFCIMLLESA